MNTPTYRAIVRRGVWRGAEVVEVLATTDRWSPPALVCTVRQPGELHVTRLLVSSRDIALEFES